MIAGDSAAKVKSLDDALRWRAVIPTGLIFTNGVFDLLHVGHVTLLETARQMGSALMVGVNSDRSAASLGKGTGRPVVPAADRARVVAALESVDCVVIFDQATPFELIRAVAPDVLVKGGDYRVDQIVGADLVTQRGGRVEIVALVPGRSSSNIIEVLRGKT